MNEEKELSTTTEETEVHTEPKEVDDKKFTQKDLDSAIEKRISRERSKFEKEIARIKSEAMTEAQRLSQLSEEERKNEELTKERAEIEQLKQELLAEQAKIAHQNLISATRDELTKLNLPGSFAEILVGQDAESTKTNLNNFNKEFQEAVTAEVNKRLKNSPKPANTKQAESTSDKVKKFKQMTLAEKQALYNSDPELYKQLSGRK